MECLIDINSKGEIKVSGQNASLFEEAFSVFNNDVDALSVYRVSLTEGFSDLEIPATVDNVLRYIERSNILEVGDFTPSELFDIYNTGRPISDFLSATTIDGEFKLDPSNMETYYSKQEISEILSDANLILDIKEMWSKAQNIGEVLEEYPIQKSLQEVVTEDKGSLGKYRVENIDKVYSKIGEVAAGVQTMEELEDAVDVATEFPIYPTEEILLEFRDKAYVPQYVENPLTGELEKKEYNSSYYKSLFTIDTGIIESDIVQKITLLEDMVGDGVVLDRNLGFTSALKDIEDTAIEYGVDLVGLSELQKGSNQIMQFLGAFADLIYNLEDVDILQEYSEQYDRLFENETDTSRGEIIGGVGGNLMTVESSKTEIELFNDNSLIKIEDNIYKKVDRDTNDIYEDLYERVLQDPSIFNKEVYYPYGFDTEGVFNYNKLANEKYKTQVKALLRTAVLSEAKQYVNNSTIPQDVMEEMVIHKRVNKSKTSVGNKTKSQYYNTLFGRDVEKLKSDFLNKLNKHLIRNKKAGLPTTPFTFTQRGLELDYNGQYSAIEALYSLPKGLQKGLIEYAIATNNIPSILEVDNFEVTVDIEEDIDFNRNYYTNFKDELPSFEGQYLYKDEGKIEASSTDKFIKVRDEIYELDEVRGEYNKISNQMGIDWNRKKPYRESPKSVQNAVSISEGEQRIGIIAPKKQKQQIDNC